MTSPGAAAERRDRSRARHLGRHGHLRVLRLRAALADAADRSARAGHAAVQPRCRSSRSSPCGRICSTPTSISWRSYVAFDHPTLVNGRRALAYPSLSVPLQTAVRLFHAQGRASTSRATSSTRTPQGFKDADAHAADLTADSGLIFERADAHRGIPLHPDAGAASCTTSTSRSGTRAGYRISKAASRTSTSRRSTPKTSSRARPHQRRQPGHGRRHLALHPPGYRHRAAAGGVAQRYYFSTQRVTLPGVRRVRTSTSSDLLAALSGHVAPHWTAEAGWQYSTDFAADPEIQRRDALPAGSRQGAER